MSLSKEIILAGYVFFCIRCFLWIRTKVL